MNPEENDEIFIIDDELQPIDECDVEEQVKKDDENPPMLFCFKCGKRLVNGDCINRICRRYKGILKNSISKLEFKDSEVI